MLTITMRFLRGAYHATPWGHHPNEGQVEWPPSPWRIARALISASYKALGPEPSDLPIVRGLIEQLASTPPAYSLPASILSHTRHYHPGASYEVLDNFLVIDRDSELVVHWDEVEPTSEQMGVLDRILPALSYLGRSESWVQARREEGWAGVPNCWPARPDEEASATIQMAVSEREFEMWREGYLEGASQNAGAKSRKGSPAIPESLWDCLIVDTNRLQKERWSRPPGSRDVAYVMGKSRAGLLEFPPRPFSRALPSVASFALAGKPLPSVLGSLLVGSTFRRALMNRYPDSEILPAALTGHDPDGGPLKGHRHGYFLPEDRDHDGRIDHVLVYFPEGITEPIVQAMGQLRTLHDRGFEWLVVLEGIGIPSDFERVSSFVGPSQTWISVTPYLHPWHRKKNGKYSADEQLLKELSLLGRFPEPVEVTQLNSVTVAGRHRVPLEFRRSRRLDVSGPDKQGSLWRIVFPESVTGPIALGAESHYGLGVFQPQA